MGKVCERVLKATLVCIIVVGCAAGPPHLGDIPPPLPSPNPSIIPRGRVQLIEPFQYPQHHHHHHLEPSPGPDPEPFQYPQHHYHLEPSPAPEPFEYPQHHHHHQHQQHLEPSPPGPEPSNLLDIDRQNDEPEAPTLPDPNPFLPLPPEAPTLPDPDPFLPPPPEAYNPTIQDYFPFPGPDYLPPPLEPVNPTIQDYFPVLPPLHSSLQQAPPTPSENRFSSFVGSFYSTPDDDDAAQGAPPPRHHAA